MRVWKIDTIHGQYALDCTPAGIPWLGMAVVSLRRPDVAGGTVQSLVPADQVRGRLQRVINAVVKRLDGTNLAG